MVKIRLSRIGKKKSPYYKIVVSDSRNPVDGRFIEQVGTYDPNTNPGTVKVNAEAVKKWLANGAQPTDTVMKLLRQAGISRTGADIEAKAKVQKKRMSKAKRAAQAEKAAQAADASTGSATAEAAPAEEAAAAAPAEEAAPAEVPVEEAAPAAEEAAPAEEA